MNVPTADELFARLLRELGDRSPTGAADLARDARVGSKWSAYVGLAPCLDLPAFTVEEEVCTPHLEHFRRAHWYCGFHWLLSDRLLDGQVEAAGTVAAASDVFEAAWRSCLAEALGSAAAANEEVDQIRGRVETAVAREQALLRGGRAPLPDYAELVADKLMWIRHAAYAHLVLVRGDAHARQFDRAAGLFFASLQCLDDAVDEADDRRRFGCGYPEALGLTANALLAAGARLTEAAADAAQAGRFRRFEAWLRKRANEVWRAIPPPSLAEAVSAAAVVGATIGRWRERASGLDLEQRK